MICPNCGRYLEDGVAFCIYCGQRLGKYASGDSAEGSQTANLNDNPLQGEANAAPADAAAESTAAHAAGAAAGAAAGTTGVATAPVAPASAQEGARSTGSRPSVSGRGRDGRLHSDDEMARRMGEIDKEPNRGNGRKAVGGVLLALLAAGAIGFGATQVVPSIMDGGNGGSAAVTTSSSSDDSSSSSSKATSSSSSSKSSKSTKSTKSTGTADTTASTSATDTKRGSTLERANQDSQATSTNATQPGGSDTVEAAPTTGDETTTGVVNTYVQPAPSAPNGFSGASATATSISPTESGITHGPDLVLDGRPETAWNTNEDGVGQSITISVNSAANVSGLRIMNGYNKISTSGNDLYWANARAKGIRIEYEGGGFDYTLEDLKGEYQTINFNSPVSTTWVKITILSVYPGSMYDDCCISEIEVI